MDPSDLTLDDVKELVWELYLAQRQVAHLRMALAGAEPVKAPADG